MLDILFYNNFFSQQCIYVYMYSDYLENNLLIVKYNSLCIE